LIDWLIERRKVLPPSTLGTRHKNDNKFFQIGSALKKRNPKQQKNKMTLIDTENTQNAKPKQTNTKIAYLLTYLFIFPISVLYNVDANGYTDERNLESQMRPAAAVGTALGLLAIMQ